MTSIAHVSDGDQLFALYVDGKKVYEGEDSLEVEPFETLIDVLGLDAEFYEIDQEWIGKRIEAADGSYPPNYYPKKFSDIPEDMLS